MGETNPDEATEAADPDDGDGAVAEQWWIDVGGEGG